MKWSGLVAITPLVAAGLAFSACGHNDPGSTLDNASDALKKAAFTTFDVNMGGCLDSPNGIDCNNYASKDDVYMNGGPTKNNLANGTYFFAVLDPGAQNTFLSGKGLLSLDSTADRTFSITNGVISYSGPHNTGTSPNGKFIIQLSPYANTKNPGGVYILAVCSVGATSPKECKFDAFKAPPSVPVPDAGMDAPQDAPPDVAQDVQQDVAQDVAQDVQEEPDACPSSDPPTCDPGFVLQCDSNGCCVCVCADAGDPP